MVYCNSWEDTSHRSDLLQVFRVSFIRFPTSDRLFLTIWSSIWEVPHTHSMISNHSHDIKIFSLINLNLVKYRNQNKITTWKVKEGIEILRAFSETFKFWNIRLTWGQQVKGQEVLNSNFNNCSWRSETCPVSPLFLLLFLLFCFLLKLSVTKRKTQWQVWA